MNTYTMICACDAGDNMIMFYVSAPNVKGAIKRLKAHIERKGDRRFAMFADLNDDDASNDDFRDGDMYALAYVFEGRLRDALTPDLFIDIDNNERA